MIQADRFGSEIQFSLAVESRSEVEVSGLQPHTLDVAVIVLGVLHALLPGSLIQGLVLTSGTEGSGANHAHGNAFDVAHTNMGNPKVKQAFTTAESVCHLLFPYFSTRTGDYHYSFVYRTPDGNHDDHAHVQANRRSRLLDLGP